MLLLTANPEELTARDSTSPVVILFIETDYKESQASAFIFELKILTDLILIW